MNPADDSLSRALRELAAASPRGASPELEARLKRAFVRHHTRRRRTRMVMFAGVVLCVMMSAVWLQVSMRSRPVKTAKAPAPSVHQPHAPLETAKVTGTAVVPVAVPHAPKIVKRKSKVPGSHHVAAPVVLANNDFVALPSFDPAIPVGRSQMMRLSMPGSALQLIGYPVNEELVNRRVLTDVLVGQDGLPYAVRLVRTQATH